MGGWIAGAFGAGLALICLLSPFGRYDWFVGAV